MPQLYHLHLLEEGIFLFLVMLVWPQLDLKKGRHFAIRENWEYGEMELNFSRNGLCVWSFGSVYCCNAVVERILHRQLLIGSTLVSLLQKRVNLLGLLTVQMDQIFWICGKKMPDS